MPTPEWEVTATESMGLEIVLWRGDSREDARAAKASYSKDACYSRVTVRERKESSD